MPACRFVNWDTSCSQSEDPVGELHTWLFKEDKWEDGPNVRFPPGAYANSTVCVHDNELFLTGGSSLYSFHYKNGTWKSFPALGKKRTQHASLLLPQQGRDMLVVCGGCVEGTRHCLTGE